MINESIAIEDLAAGAVLVGIYAWAIRYYWRDWKNRHTDEDSFFYTPKAGKPAQHFAAASATTEYGTKKIRNMAYRKSEPLLGRILKKDRGPTGNELKASNVILALIFGPLIFITVVYISPLLILMGLAMMVEHSRGTYQFQEGAFLFKCGCIGAIALHALHSCGLLVA